MKERRTAVVHGRTGTYLVCTCATFSEFRVASFGCRNQFHIVVAEEGTIRFYWFRRGASLTAITAA